MPSCRRVCISVFAIFFTIAFIFVGIPLILLFELSKPRRVTFTLEHVSVTGFNHTPDNGRLTSLFAVVIKADNRKPELHYDHVWVSIFKDKQKLAEDRLNAFFQHKRNVTLISAEPVALNVTLKKGPAFNFGIESGMGYLDFDVYMTATLNCYYKLEANCKHAVVNVTTTANASFPVSSYGHNFKGIGCSVDIYTSLETGGANTYGCPDDPDHF